MFLRLDHRIVIWPHFKLQMMVDLSIPFLNVISKFDTGALLVSELRDESYELVCR